MPNLPELKKIKIAHQVHAYDHDPKSTDFGEEAVEKTNFPAQQVFKTLVVETQEKELVVAVLPVACKLDLKIIFIGCLFFFFFF